jgi:hypothetical protein
MLRIILAPLMYHKGLRFSLLLPQINNNCQLILPLIDCIQNYAQTVEMDPTDID